MNDQTRASRDAAVKRPEDENLGVTANLMYGLQHVLTMYGGIVAVPLIVAEAAGMSAADAGRSMDDGRQTQEVEGDARVSPRPISSSDRQECRHGR